MLGGLLSPRQGASSGSGWRNGLQLWRVAANIMKEQLRTADKGWSSSLYVERGANNALAVVWHKETVYHHCFSSLLVKYVIRNVHKTQEGLKLNGTHQLLACAAEVNLTN
jgi:hypothetical protein